MQYQNEVEETKKKEQLLKSEIYDKGYDCQAFQDFMEQLKQNGGQDVNIWTFQEIKDAINLFQTTNSPIMQTIELDDITYRQSHFDDQISNEQQKEQQQSTQVQEQKQEEQIQQQSVVVQQTFNSEEILAKPLIDNDKYYQKIHLCKLQEKKMIFTPKEVNVQIVNYERVPGGIFSSAYYQYNVITEPLGWSVKRRYNDFQWLRDVLCKIYPGKCIPPLPKKSVLKNEQPLYLQKRLKFLERFLKSIFACELLKNDKWYYAFLSIKEEKDFKHIQQLSTKLQRITKLEQVISLEGQLQLQINENLAAFNQEAFTLINNTEIHYKKLRKDSKQLLLDFDQLSNTIFNMGQTCASLYQQSNKFNQSIPQGKNSQLDILYISMNNMLVQWGNNLTSQIKIVQDELCYFFKFYHQQINTLKDFLKQKEHAEQEYEKFKSKLEIKKHKLFQSQDFNRWEIPSIQIKALQDSNLISNKDVCLTIMLPQETSMQEDLKNIFAYYNSQTFTEVQSLLEKVVKEFSDHFINFCSLQKESIAEQKLIWDKSIINFNNLHFPQEIINKTT